VNHRFLLALKWTAALIGGPILLYLVAAVAGALIPRNSGWTEPEDGIQLFVRTNGVHADLVLPARTDTADWYEILDPEHVRDPEAARGWIGIGWGQREFYLEVVEWENLTARVALRALTGGDTLIHVGHLARPEPSPSHRPFRLSHDAYRDLVESILGSFERSLDGDVVPLIGQGHGSHDTFYEAHGTYHAFRTSNQWTSDMLAVAGVEIGLWTPFEESIMWRFRSEADPDDRLDQR
jgi:uncharacterized protein (TIGR02117 family)